MPFWIQRASKIASIARFQSHAHIESCSSASTLWFIKVVCTLCIYRAATSSFNIFGSDYFRKNLNPYITFSVVCNLNNKFHDPRLAFGFFQYARINLTIVYSVSAFNLLIRSLCEKGLHDSAKLVFDYMIADGFLPDNSILELLVRSFANAGMFRFAKEVLVSQARLSDEKEGVVSPFVYNEFLNLLMKRKHVDEAVSFFRDHILKLQSFSLDTSSFNIVIQGLCSVRRVEKAFKIFDNMGSFGCFPDTITYNSLINGLCKVGNVDRAREVLNDMQSQGGVSPDVVSYTSIISGYCKLGKMEEAVNHFDEMITFGIRPNSFTFNALIDGFGKTRDMVSALKMHQRMLLLGCPPDVVTYTSLINGHCHVGELDKGLKLWNELDGKKLYPNLYTFSILINALCKENRQLEARNLLRQLQRRDDIVPQPFIYNPVIDGFCKAGNVDEANVIVTEMEAEKCYPDKLTFTILILGHCMKGRMFEAISIFNKMLAVGCAPDKITVNSLASCLLKAGMAKEAYRIKQIAFESLLSGSSSIRTMRPSTNMDIPVTIPCNPFCKHRGINLEPVAL